jgi:GDPmannose 4,6-dehydratase
LQHDEPGDYVVATGEVRTVRDVVARAFAAVGIDDWDPYVTSNAEFVRPTEARVLAGDATRAREVLGWKPEVSFDELVENMVQHDLAALAADPREAGHGF